ncbi:hypothetical protein CYMTET_45496 [Cymbomonas tetramitiformis]|uniref:Uncharacterized protein n=1 Tax=Cymbomonas tetramitiformis TaxID=36881 RepID=A0AAE0EYJ7_9CHLO|nr:hypothetical protein CYMTET_45496 [Cymbomonas tetramitiformis]|eukprot:gene7545-8983_t
MTVYYVVNEGLVSDNLLSGLFMWISFLYAWQFLEFFIVFKDHFFSKPTSGYEQTANMDCPPATAVIVAYLPNEADIIMETLAHFRAIEYDNELQVILAYNSPKILPVEQDIAKLQKAWPQFSAVKVAGSTSKCDNVNEVLKNIKGVFVGIFDADHLPLPNSFQLAWGDLSRGADVVQGRTKINARYVDSALSHIIAAEFEVRHGLEHHTRKSVYGYAVFGGSNGFWRTDALQAMGMDPAMLTEDIDSSVRAMSYGYKITYNHHLISLEQPPPSLHALVKQRLRWSQGWYQVSWRSWFSIFSCEYLSLRQKIGMHWMLKMLLPLQVLVSAGQSFTLVTLSSQLGFAIVFMMTSVWCIPQLLFLFKFAEVPSFSTKLLYALNVLPLLMFFMVIDMIAQVRLMIGYSTWHITSRKKVEEDRPPLSPSTFRYSPSSVHLSSEVVERGPNHL